MKQGEENPSWEDLVDKVD